MFDAQLQFLASDGFEWDENKSDANLAKHGIAFGEASEVFDGPIVVRRSDRNSEERWVAVGKSQDRLVAVIFTVRNKMIRIISARHPRPNEERAHRNASMGRSAKGQD
ncbi:MAG: BrnT family toxin [Bradyrhizobium sp.]|nr:BrnT family toxin [Bradyrhizobium sp.]